MKITATVVESEFLSKTYTIECGKGSQYIYWIGTTACALFGQDHYPAGIYIPTLIQKDDGEVFLHPRQRVAEKLVDGDKVTVFLKNRQQKQDNEDYKEWYEMAFGEKKNMMRVSMYYTAVDQKMKAFPIDCYIEYKFTMFPEFEDEFDKDQYNTECTLAQMEHTADYEDQNEFEFELQLPYGSFEILSWKWAKRGTENPTEEELKEIDNTDDVKGHNVIPKPISQEEQRIMDN